jgi:hypothetical protein
MASFERMGQGDRHGLLPYQTASPISQWNPSPTLSYQAGNQGRNALYGIGAWTVNASLARNIRVREGHKLNIRGEAFNALNKANHNTPSTNYLSPTTFGIITSARTMRQLLLSLKYGF